MMETLVTLVTALATTFLVQAGRKLSDAFDRAPAWAKQVAALVFAWASTYLSTKLGIDVVGDLSTLDVTLASVGTALISMGMYTVLKRLGGESAR